MYNHKQRREMEKSLGFHKEYQKMNEADKAEVRKKKRETGEQIHLRNLQEWENQRLASEAESEAKQLQTWIEGGKTYEEAAAIIAKNRERQEHRAIKLAERKERQNAKLAASSIKKN